MTSRGLLVLVAACRGGAAVHGPMIQVDTALPGAGAGEMAAAVATPLERQLGQIPALQTMASTSAIGRTQIRLGFAPGTDLDAATQSVQAALNAAANLLPQSLPGPPTYAKVGEHVARFLVDDPAIASARAHHLEQLPGVGRVDLCGMPPAERWLGVSPERLASTGLAIDDVLDALRMGNGDLRSPQIGVANGVPIRVGDVVHELAPHPPACRAFDAKGEHIAIDVFAQPGADLAALTERLGAPPRAPDTRELLVELVPGAQHVRLDHAVAEASGMVGFLIEQRGDGALVEVELAGDGQAVASAAMHLRHVEGVASAGAPTTIVELSGADPAEVARVAKLVAARFTARGALVATEGLAQLPVVHPIVDRDAAARLGITAQAIDRALAARTGIIATTIFTQLDQTRVFLVVDGDGPQSVRATGGTLVPLDSVMRLEQRAEPLLVLHAGQFPAIRLYTTDGEVGDVPPGVRATVAPYR